jgi:cytochrome bd-type quinol oxidase subunit 2
MPFVPKPEGGTSMKFLRSLAFAVTAWLSLATPALAAGDAAACGACAGCGGIMILIPIAFVVIGILYMVWVAKDAKSRGMDTPILWMILAVTWVGLIVYLLVRPKGKLVACPHCGEKRLENSEKCPHCGKA